MYVHTVCVSVSCHTLIVHVYYVCMLCVSVCDEDLARVMDGLAAEAATGVHSTK